MLAPPPGGTEDTVLSWLQVPGQAKAAYKFVV